LRSANIGPGERRKRRRFGHIALGISIALGAALLLGAVGQRWRLVLFVPLFVAALGYFQDRDRT